MYQKPSHCIYKNRRFSMGMKHRTIFTTTLFSYKQGSSFIHRIPAAAKLLLLFPAGFAAFYLSIPVCIAAIFFMMMISFSVKFSLYEQLRAMIPAILYAPVLYIALVVGTFVETGFEFTWKVLLPDSNTVLILLRMIFILLTTNLLFGTTTMLELRASISQIETIIRTVLSKIPYIGKSISTEPSFALLLSLFLSFFPLVFKEWQRLERSWKARGGKTSIKKFIILLPALISVSMYHATTTAKSVANRS